MGDSWEVVRCECASDQLNETTSGDGQYALQDSGAFVHLNNNTSVGHVPTDMAASD